MRNRSVMSNSLQPHALYSLQARILGVGSLSLLQGIFPTRGSNPDLPLCRRILYQLSHKGNPDNLPTSSLKLKKEFMRLVNLAAHFTDRNTLSVYVHLRGWMAVSLTLSVLDLSNVVLFGACIEGVVLRDKWVIDFCYSHLSIFHYAWSSHTAPGQL